MRTIIHAVCLSFTLSAAHGGAQSLSLSAPPLLPRNYPLSSFAPRIVIHYANLGPGDYSVKLWLLDSEHFNCASSQWCARALAIENVHGSHAQGELVVNVAMDVYDYPAFIWVARLYDATGAEKAFAKASSKGTPLRPALLKPINRRHAVAGQCMRIQLELHDPKSEAASFRVLDNPPGSAIDSKSGLFTWTPAISGAWTLTFEAIKAGSELADAEVVTIEVSAAEKPVVKYPTNE